MKAEDPAAIGGTCEKQGETVHAAGRDFKKVTRNRIPTGRNIAVERREGRA